jgi:hypothetical protein
MERMLLEDLGKDHKGLYWLNWSEYSRAQLDAGWPEQAESVCISFFFLETRSYYLTCTPYNLLYSLGWP